MYLAGFSLYNESHGCNVDYESMGRIFMFFNSTLARDIHKMGKILLPYTWEILTHPNDPTGPNGTIRGHTRSQTTIEDHTGAYKTAQS